MSVLTACYNGRKFLKKCADSIANQSDQDWEWIFVDDCSTDESVRIARSYRRSGLNVKIIRNKKRLGCSSSYRKALEAATGELCGILDADDAIKRNAVRRIKKAYDKNASVDFIYTRHHWCNDALMPKGKGLSSKPHEGKSLVDMSLDHRKHCYSHWRTFRTYLRDKADIFPEGLECAVDKNMGFLLEQTGPGGFLPEFWYLYRFHRENMSRKQGGRSRRTWRRLAKQYRIDRKRKKLQVYPIIEIAV